MHRAALPTPDLAALDAVARRTALLRAGLVLALVVALGAVAALARGPGGGGSGLLPAGTTGIVVLDGSASVGSRSRIAELLPDVHPNPNRRIAAVLRALAKRDEPVGLVLFSDVAYELLPPGSPGRELASLTRFFETEHTDDSAVATPWADSFTGGTRISVGLAKALQLVRRDGIEPAAILLVSDLDAPGDTGLAEALAGIREAEIPLRIVALDPAEERRELFAKVFGPGAFVTEDELEGAAPAGPAGTRVDEAPRAASPAWLLVAGAVVLLLLGLHERVLVRVPVPGREAR